MIVSTLFACYQDEELINATSQSQDIFYLKESNLDIADDFLVKCTSEALKELDPKEMLRSSYRVVPFES